MPTVTLGVPMVRSQTGTARLEVPTGNVTIPGGPSATVTGTGLSDYTGGAMALGKGVGVGLVGVAGFAALVL